MQNELIITVFGTPVPKARARATRSGHHYTPAKTVAYERLIRAAAIQKMAEAKQAMLNVPVTLCVTFEMPIPKSYSAKKRGECLSGYIQHTSKPDLDNLIKSVSDALNGAVYKDDSYVVKIISEKRYSDEPFTLISIKPKY
jgi:Holliday junction resolvase RusA-like endonuclease